MADGFSLGRPQNPRHGDRVPRPPRGLRAQLRASTRGELIELRLAIVLGEAPLGLDQATLLESMERRIKRPFLDLQLGPARLGDPPRDCVAMSWSPAQRLEHEDIEG